MRETNWKQAVEYGMRCFESFHLKKYSCDQLSAYLKYYLATPDDKRDVPFNFKVCMSEAEGIRFLHTFENMMQTVRPEYRIGTISERDLLQGAGQIQGKNSWIELLGSGAIDALAVVDCENEDMTAEDLGRWRLVDRQFRKTISAPKFLCCNENLMQKRFAPDERLYYQLFSNDIRVYKADESNAGQLVIEALVRKGYTVSPDFEGDLRAYVEDVYPKALKQEMEFVDDLVERVIREYWIHHSVDDSGRLDALCVPYHVPSEKSTNVPAAEISGDTTQNQKNQISESKLNDDREILSLEVPVFSAKDERLITEQVQEISRKRAPKILLLALSTMRSTLVRNQYSCHIKGIEVAESKDTEYEYQMEPVTEHLIRQLKGRGTCLDEMILLATDATVERKEGIRIEDRESETKITTAISALDYFVYKINTACQEEGIKCPEILVIRQENANQVKAEEVDRIVEHIRSLKETSSGFEPDLYIDIHGGLRPAQQTIENVLSLLRLENIPINTSHIYSVEYDNSRKVGTIILGGESIGILNFITGIHEVIHYARTDSLRQYLNSNPTSRKEEKKLLSALENLAESIQMCQIGNFEKDIRGLKYKIEKVRNEKEDSYLKTFLNLIEENYSELLDEGDWKKNEDGSFIISVPNEIKFCLHKGFYQQALTLIEGRMPIYLQEVGVFQYDEAAKQNLINSGRKYYEGNDATIWIFNNTFPGSQYRENPIHFYNANIKIGNKIKVGMGKQEDPGAEEVVNEFLSLHFSLKQQRNVANHADPHTLRNPYETNSDEQDLVQRIKDQISRYLICVQTLEEEDYWFKIQAE